MILTDEEIEQVFLATFSDDSPLTNTEWTAARAIEAKVLDKINGLKPVAWRVFDGEGGYDYCGYTDNEDYRDEFIKRNPSPTYKNWVEPLYALEKK